jgi:hypothetical protein
MSMLSSSVLNGGHFAPKQVIDGGICGFFDLAGAFGWRCRPSRAAPTVRVVKKRRSGHDNANFGLAPSFPFCYIR